MTDPPAEHGDTPDLTEQIAGVLAEHGADYIVGANRCLCGAVIHDDSQFRAHISAAVADRLSARSAATPDWPCANYRAPTTCLTAPSSEAGRCDWCSAQAAAATPDTAARALARVQALADDVQRRWERRGAGQRLVPLSRLRAALDDRPDPAAPVQPVTDQKDDR